MVIISQKLIESFAKMLFVGAGGEIGGGTAAETAKWGANLALIDIHEGRLEETMDKLTKMGVQKNRVIQ